MFPTIGNLKSKIQNPEWGGVNQVESPLQTDFIRWIVFLPLLGAIINGLLGAKIQKSMGKSAAIVRPMKATAVSELPEGNEWIYEVKWTVIALSHSSRARISGCCL